MKIIEWNINQRANHINTEEIPPFIAKAILAEQADIFVLTECYQVKKWGEFLSNFSEYQLFCTNNSCKHQNDILIGVRKTLGTAKMAGVLESAVDNVHPNYLHVAVEVDGTRLHVIGVRIRVPKTAPSSIESQTFRLNQLDLLLELIDVMESEKEEPCIVVGDFNNYRRGLSPATLEMKRDNSYSKCALWNMAVIGERFHEVDFTMHTPEGFSWGWDNPNIKYQFAQDHAITKGIDFSVRDDGSECCEYTENFLGLAPEVYGAHGIKQVHTPFPDHKMLAVEFDVEIIDVV